MDEDIKKAAHKALEQLRAEERRIAEWLAKQALERCDPPRVTAGIGDPINNYLIKMKTLTRGESPLSATTRSPVLCYVEEQWAYFTTKKLSEQWGDDWNDIPYEHNAGEPYTYTDHDRKEGCDPWEIVKVAWEGDFETPCAHQLNSQWSVERINEGGVAWMQTSSWKSGESVIIRAGTTLSDFCRLVAEGGGKVYFENAKGEPLA